MKTLSEINPANALEALRLARTEESAKQILEEGYTFELDTELEMVAVCKPGKESAAYWIFLGEGDDLLPQGCNCPDFLQRGGYCKHTLAWETWQKAVAGYRLTFNHGDGTFQLEKFAQPA